MAVVYGEKSLHASLTGNLLPFFVGYSYEALARVVNCAGDDESKRRYLALVQEEAENTVDPQGKERLLKDLDTI